MYVCLVDVRSRAFLFGRDRISISIAADAGTDAVLDLTGCRMCMLRGPARTRSASVWSHSAQARLSAWVLVALKLKLKLPETSQFSFLGIYSGSHM